MEQGLNAGSTVHRPYKTCTQHNIHIKANHTQLVATHRYAARLVLLSDMYLFHNFLLSGYFPTPFCE